MRSFPLSILSALAIFPVSLALRNATHTNILKQVIPGVGDKHYHVVNGDLYEIGAESDALQFENYSASKPMITTTNDRQVSVWRAIDEFESYKSSINYSTR